MSGQTFGGAAVRTRVPVVAVMLACAALSAACDRTPETVTADDSTGEAKPFSLPEATITDIHAAYKAGTLTSRQLVQQYLDRIEAFDKQGPALHAIMNVNPKALEEADRLDAALKSSGFVGPLHGIPVIVKDQADVKGMPMMLGSALLKDYYPERDAFVVDKVRKAGAIVIAMGTKPELIGGDTYSSVFGATRNPYALDRTAGGSSGGPGASIAANFATIAVGQEGSASIRRPSGWNSIVGMRPTAGLVSRTGVWNGWPMLSGSLGPMARTVEDLARLLDVMVGYDPDDPLTAYSVGQVPESYAKGLDRNALKGARLGILREAIGQSSEPDSEDFAKVTAVFDRAVQELKAAGAQVVDPLVIPDLKALLGQRSSGFGGPGDDFEVYVRRNPNFPFKTNEEMVRAPGSDKIWPGSLKRLRPAPGPASAAPSARRPASGRDGRQELMINVLKVMADHRLDAIVYKTVEHQPTLIKDGFNPPFVSAKGAPQFNTFLVFVPAISVPAGFTSDNLPVGITFQGRPFSDAHMIRLAYSYEQTTHHRKPPASVARLN